MMTSTPSPLLTDAAVSAAAEPASHQLSSAPGRLHKLAGDFAASLARIAGDVLLSEAERDRQLARAARNVEQRKDQLADEAILAAQHLHELVEQVRTEVATAPVPMSADRAAIAAAWQRAWSTLTGKTPIYGPGMIVTEGEIMHALSSGAEPATLAALHGLVPLFCAAEDGYESTGEPAAKRSAHLLELADSAARRTAYGAALGAAAMIEQLLPQQERAVHAALDELEAALSVARLQATRGKR